MIFRKAKISDIEKIAGLINYYAEREVMLHRTIPSMYQRVRDYTVIEENQTIIAVGSLHVLWSDLAEICSLAVRPESVKSGLGSSLVENLIREGADLGVKNVFALTYQPGFFEKCGFVRIEKENLPQKVWTECINCPKFPHCDEIALSRNV